MCWVALTPRACKQRSSLQLKARLSDGSGAFFRFCSCPLELSDLLSLHNGSSDFQVLILTGGAVVMGFSVWAICMVSKMIASWFSIARKCEELPLQRHVCPTSTNPQLMASRSNRPQQPHILHKLHVHNSFARLKKRPICEKKKKSVSAKLVLAVIVIGERKKLNCAQ